MGPAEHAGGRRVGVGCGGLSVTRARGRWGLGDGAGMAVALGG